MYYSQRERVLSHTQIAATILLAFLTVAPARIAAAGDSTAPAILTGDVAPIAGPRRSIEVGSITASGPITAPNDSWDVTGGLATMLTTALTESGRFVVVERETLDQLKPENELAANQESNGTIAPQQEAHVVAAQYLVTGMVTEYGANNNGTNVGVGGGMFGSDSSPGLSLSHTSGKVAIDLRVVSTQTATVAGAFTVSEDISDTSVGLSGGYEGIPFGIGQFWQTPIGEATRAVLTKAVGKIVAIVAGGSWQGQIADVDGNQIIVNAGRAAGVKVGDQFAVERISKTITDPATAEVLGIVKKRLGAITITDVEEKYSTGTYSALAPTPPQRGDLVVMAK